MYCSSPSYYQTVSELPAFRRGVMQKGYVLGGIFKGIMRSVAPKLKQSLAYVGKRALKIGLKCLEDVATGEDLKSLLKRPIKGKVTEKKISIKRTAKKKRCHDKLIHQRDMFLKKVMTTVVNSKKDHIECSISHTDLFAPAFAQSDIESGRYEGI